MIETQITGWFRRVIQILPQRFEKNSSIITSNKAPETGRNCLELR
jgi:hypothetical protein